MGDRSGHLSDHAVFFEMQQFLFVDLLLFDVEKKKGDEPARNAGQRYRVSGIQVVLVKQSGACRQIKRQVAEHQDGYEYKFGFEAARGHLPLPIEAYGEHKGAAEQNGKQFILQNDQIAEIECDPRKNAGHGSFEEDG